MSEQFSPGTAVVGLLFIALGTLFLLDELDVLHLRPALVLPILLIGLGVGVLVSILRPERQSARHGQP